MPATGDLVILPKSLPAGTVSDGGDVVVLVDGSGHVVKAVALVTTGAGGPTAVSDGNPLPVTVQGAGIVVPTDQQDLLKSQQVLSTSNINAGASFTTAAIDMSKQAWLSGRVLMDQAGTLQLFVSDDGSTWDHIAGYDTAIVANTPVLMQDANKRPFYVPTPYAQLVLKNTGGAATTVVRLSAYSHPTA